MALGVVALIFAAALLGPAVSLLSRGVVPIVVGQLLAGVVLGRTGLELVDPNRSDLALLYQLGFATLMFTVGMYVPLRDRRLRAALRPGLAAVAVALPLALGAGFAAHALAGGPALLYGVVLVSSSAAIALPIIDESGLEGAPVLAALTWITIADVLATVAIPLALEPGRAPRAALAALGVMALVAATFLLAGRLRHAAWVRHARRESKRREWALDLRVAVLVLVTLSYVAEEIGASLLVAGFGTGLVVGALGGPRRLSREVLGLGQGFLVPVFFVLLGAKLDLRALDADAVGLAGLLAGLALAVHVAVALVIRVPRAVGLLASAQVGVPAAVIALGLPAHAIDQAQASAIFCAALVCIGASATGAALLRRGQARDLGSPGAAAAPDLAPAARAPRLPGG